MMELKELDKTNKAEVQLFVEKVNANYAKVAYPPTLNSIQQSSNTYFWAIIDNNYIGTTGYSLKTPTLAESIKTVVFAEFRGKGFGKILSQMIEDHCRSIGIKKIMTTIYSYNYDMIAIKLKQGYTIEGFHKDHEAPGFDEYSLGKLL
jgi:RimJ/RimL family protein N-acetyltransferase